MQQRVGSSAKAAQSDEGHSDRSSSLRRIYSSSSSRALGKGRPPRITSSAT